MRHIVQLAMTRSAEAIAKRAEKRGSSVSQQRQSDWNDHVKRLKTEDPQKGLTRVVTPDPSAQRISSQPKTFIVPRSQEKNDIATEDLQPHVATEKLARQAAKRKLTSDNHTSNSTTNIGMNWPCVVCLNSNYGWRDECFRCRRSRWGAKIIKSLKSKKQNTTTETKIAQTETKIKMSMTSIDTTNTPIKSATAMSIKATDSSHNATSDTPCQWASQASPTTIALNDHLRSLARICSTDGNKNQAAVDEWLALPTHEQDRALLLLARSERKAQARLEAKESKLKAKIKKIAYSKNNKGGSVRGSTTKGK